MCMCFSRVIRLHVVFSELLYLSVSSACFYKIKNKRLMNSTVNIILKKICIFRFIVISLPVFFYS